MTGKATLRNSPQGSSCASQGHSDWGDAVVVHRDQKLSVPLQTHQRELPQRHIEPPIGAVIEYQRLPKALGDKGGDLRQASTVAGRCGRAIRHLGIQHDGIHRLHHGDGQIRPHPAGDIQLVKRRVRGEDLGAPLAAKQDTALVKDAQPLRLGIAGRAGADLQGDPVEKPHIDGVEPAVEGDRLYVRINIQQLRRAPLDHLGCTKHLLCRCGGIEAQILHTVLVAAGVKDLPCMDANGLAHAAQIADGARHQILRHGMTS